MPTTTQDRMELQELVFAVGGEPGGRPELPTSGALVDGSPLLAAELVDDAVARAAGRRRVRQAFSVASDRWISGEVIDELLAGAGSEEEIAGPGGLLAQLIKRLVERAMEVELADHVGYERHCELPGGTGNQRNGSSPKTLITEHGRVEIDAPGDRDGSFQPKIVGKRQRRFVGFDEKILALYSRGFSMRDISAHLEEIYGANVSRDLISRVTDAVMDDVREWAKRPLEKARFLVVVANQLVVRCGFHRAINWVGVRSSRHTRGLSLSSLAPLAGARR
jgi:hypothetical protein